MPVHAVLAVFGALSGITTVLFGFGGGFVTVPLIYNTLASSAGRDGAAMHIAVATSTAVMVVSSLLATWRHAGRGNIAASALWPLGGFIGLGSVIGAVLAIGAPGAVLRWAFVVYLGGTILDCLLRSGFLHGAQSGAPAPRRGRSCEAGPGIVIGAVATFLGVGGSVMTVPLMRRRGMDMTRATAMANPLTVPVALVGTAAYALVAHPGATVPGWHVGDIDVTAFAILVVASLLGIAAASPLIGRIPDRLHAKAYVGLLVIVLLSMVA